MVSVPGAGHGATCLSPSRDWEDRELRLILGYRPEASLSFMRLCLKKKKNWFVCGEPAFNPRSGTCAWNTPCSPPPNLRYPAPHLPPVLSSRALDVTGTMLWVLVRAVLPVMLLAAPPPINKLALFPDKSAWCEAKNITQIVGHSGCEAKSIQNRWGSGGGRG